MIGISSLFLSPARTAPRCAGSGTAASRPSSTGPALRNGACCPGPGSGPSVTGAGRNDASGAHVLGPHPTDVPMFDSCPGSTCLLGWCAKEVEAMLTTLASPGSILRALIVAIVLLAIAIGLASALGSSLAFLPIVWWGLAIVVAAAGALLLLRGRPIAGVGALLVAVSVLVAFQVAIES